MRIQLIPNLSTKDGEANKNARMTNALSEKNPTGTVFCTVRPGLEKLAEAVGNGRGIVEFNGKLLSVYGATLNAVDVPDFLGRGLEDKNLLNTDVAPVQSFPRYINTDGTVVVGQYLATVGAKRRAFHWTEATKMVDLGDLGGTASDTARAFFCSDDGETVIGIAANASNVQVPFQWTEDAGMTAVSGFSLTTTMSCASRDCTTFAGQENNIPYYWTQSGGVVSASFGGTNEFVYDCSDDGIIVGRSTISGTQKAVKRDINGTVTQITSGVAWCCSSDGSVVFGSGLYSGLATPFKYEGGVYTELIPTVRGAVMACSQDGNWAFGWARYLGVDVFFRWGRTTGITYIDTFTEFGGIVASSATNTIYSISDDGKTAASICYESGSAKYIHFSWNETFGLIDIEENALTQDSFTSIGPFVSGNGNYLITNLLISYLDYTFYLWSRDLGQFRSVATLEDQFFDFVQSTI